MRLRREGWHPAGLALLLALQQAQPVQAAELLPQDQDGLAWWLHWIVRGIEVTGIAVIVLGALAASAHAAGQLLRGGSRRKPTRPTAPSSGGRSCSASSSWWPPTSSAPSRSTPRSTIW